MGTNIEEIIFIYLSATYHFIPVQTSAISKDIKIYDSKYKYIDTYTNILYTKATLSHRESGQWTVY